MSEQCGKSETSYCNQPFFPHPIFMPQTTDFADALRRALLQAEISVECVEETGSTSDDLKQRIRERPLAHPVLRTSERQTAGRGTRGKSWKTPRESLLFTLALPYATQGDECVRLPIVVGISVAESLQRLGYPVALKWPNDLWLRRHRHRHQSRCGSGRHDAGLAGSFASRSGTAGSAAFRRSGPHARRHRAGFARRPRRLSQNARALPACIVAVGGRLRQPERASVRSRRVQCRTGRRARHYGRRRPVP